MDLPFKATIWRTGNSYVVTIPYSYVENGMLETGKEYQLNVTEVVSDVAGQ